MKLRAYFHICMAIVGISFELYVFILLITKKYRKYKKYKNETISQEKMIKARFIFLLISFFVFLYPSVLLLNTSILDVGYVIRDDYPIFEGTVIKKDGGDDPSVYIYNDQTDKTIKMDIYNAKVNINEKIVISYLPNMHIAKLIKRSN